MFGLQSVVSSFLTKAILQITVSFFNHHYCLQSLLFESHLFGLYMRHPWCAGKWHLAPGANWGPRFQANSGQKVLHLHINGLRKASLQAVLFTLDRGRMSEHGEALDK